MTTWTGHEDGANAAPNSPDFLTPSLSLRDLIRGGMLLVSKLSDLLEESDHGLSEDLRSHRDAFLYEAVKRLHDLRRS